MERRIESKFRHRLPRVKVDAKGHKILTVEGARPLRIRDFTLEGEDLERASGNGLGSIICSGVMIIRTTKARGLDHKRSLIARCPT